jgi:soluble lytic murein transglycosylase
VDPRLVASLIWKESRFRPGLTGKAGEIGLMQVTEAAGREWAEAHDVHDFAKHDLFQPETNVRAGTWYLARAIEHWSDRPDPLPFALAEYNAGRANATRWAVDAETARAFRDNITYPTTKRYVRDVLKRYRGGV